MTYSQHLHYKRTAQNDWRIVTDSHDRLTLLESYNQKRHNQTDQSVYKSRTSTQVIETLVTATNNIPPQDYSQPED